MANFKPSIAFFQLPKCKKCTQQNKLNFELFLKPTFVLQADLQKVS